MDRWTLTDSLRTSPAIEMLNSQLAAGLVYVAALCRETALKEVRIHEVRGTSVCGQSVDSLWTVCGQSVVSLWSVCGQSVVSSCRQHWKS